MPRITDEQRAELRRAREGPFDRPLRYFQRGERTLGLLGGTVVGGALNQLLDPYDITPVGRWLPDLAQVPEAFSAFEEQRRQGDWDAAIGAYHEELGGGPGFWGASEALTSAFVPTGGPALAGKGLIRAAPKFAETIAGVVPRVIRPAVETGVRAGVTGFGQAARAPWEAEEWLGRQVMKAPVGIWKGIREPLLGDRLYGTELADVADLAGDLIGPRLPDEEVVPVATDILGAPEPTIWAGVQEELSNLRRDNPALVFMRENQLINDARQKAEQAADAAYNAEIEWNLPPSGEIRGWFAGAPIHQTMDEAGRISGTIGDEGGLELARRASNAVFRQFQTETGIDVRDLIYTTDAEAAELLARPSAIPEAFVEDLGGLPEPLPIGETAYSDAPTPTAAAPTKLFHGTRHPNPESFIDENGNLVLRASENFEGRQVGVSFSESQDTALDYATRIPGRGPARARAQGAVFEIDADAIPSERLFVESGEELATRGAESVIIPKGKFRIIKDVAARTELEKWEAEQIARVKRLSDQELARAYDDYEAAVEVGEYNRVYEDPFARAAPGVSQDIVAEYGPVQPSNFPLFDEMVARVTSSSDPEGAIARMVSGLPEIPQRPVGVSREQLAERIRQEIADPTWRDKFMGPVMRGASDAPPATAAPTTQAAPGGRPDALAGEAAGRAVRGGDEGFQMEMGFEGGASPPPDMPSTAGPPTTPPEGVRGGYLGNILSMNQTVSEVITWGSGRLRDNPVVRWVAAKSGINPSVLATDPLAKGVVAFNRLLVSSREMTNVALSAALDKHVQRGLGTLERALPIDQETGFLRGTNHPWQDVFSDPDRYAAQLTPETRAYIDDFNALIAEMNQRLRDRGLAQLPTRDVDGKFYVPRQVKEVGGVTLEQHSNPNLRRVYDEALEGYEKGIRYDVDPRATLEIYLNAGWRDMVQQDLQIYMLEHATAITPKQLINPALVRNVEESARALREAHSLLAAAQKTRLRLQTGGRFRGEAAKAQRVLREAKRPEVLANDKAIKTAKSTVTRLRKRYNAQRAIYQSEMKAAKTPGPKPAQANLFGLAGDHISIQMWRNKFYPKNQAEALIKGVDSLREGKVVTPIAKLINTMRTGAAVGDFAMPFIHGQVMLFRNPAGWAKMTAKHYESFFDPTVQSRVINDNLEDFQWLARNNVPIGDPEFFAGAMTGQGLPLGMPLGTGRARRVLRAFGRQTFGRFQSSYNVGLGIARLEMLKALRPTWKGTDAELAQYLRNVTGGLDSRALGVGPSQRNIESMFLAFSPRLLRSTVALVGDAMRPGTPQGREALRSLGSWVAGIHMTYILTGVALGKTWEEIQRGMNPLEGGKYLSHEINGDWIGAGGQVRAILQAIAHITATVGGGDASGLTGGGIMANPLLRAYYYRAAPGTSLGVAAGEFVFQRDLSPFEELDTLPDLVLHIVTSSAPFALQGWMEGEQAMTTGFALGGARTGITRPEAAIYELTLNVGGVESNYFDLYKHPKVIEYAKKRLPADLHDLADEYIEADYDRQKEMRLVESGRKVADAFEKAKRGPTQDRRAGALYILKGEFLRAAPTEWKMEMAMQDKDFPGKDRLRDWLLLQIESGKRLPDVDYSQWYRRGDVSALESLVGSR